MSAYASLITEHARCDEQTAVVIEELMRTVHPTLDGLQPWQFRMAAIDAVTDMKALAAMGELEAYCDALEIECPPMPWASAIS